MSSGAIVFTRRQAVLWAGVGNEEDDVSGSGLVVRVVAAFMLLALATLAVLIYAGFVGG